MIETREMVQSVVELGKKQKSAHTQFLHREDGHVISFYDNLLFSLALFRLKTADSVSEGKALLEKLLRFQTPSGSFPQFLHEFPDAKNTFFPIKLLPVLFQIHSEFSAVLGKDLEQNLSQNVKRLINLCGKEQLTFPYSFTLQILKKCFLDEALPEKFFSSAKEKIGDFNSQDWGQIIYALSFLSPQNRDPIFAEEAAFLYHSEMATYIGPAHNEPHEGFLPKKSLLDLFFGKGFFLEGAKVYPFSIPDVSKEGLRTYPSSRGSWKVLRTNSYALSFLEEKEESPYQKNAYLFRLLWGKDHLNNFTLPKTAFPVSIKGKEGALEALFSLPSVIPEEGKEDMEVALYLDALGEAGFQVDEKKTNTFRLEDGVVVTKGGMEITLTFTCISGEGKFFGHILRANRPAQKPPAYRGDFAAYDWKIGLRTIARTPSCQILLKMSFRQRL